VRLKTEPISERGFILPSVLLIGLGVLLIGASLIQSSTSIRSSIENKYYNDIAREAAEAGVVYARYCLKESSTTSQTWGPSAARPNLSPSTACDGADMIRKLTSLTGDPNAPSTFTVGDSEVSAANSMVINASGSSRRANSRAETIASFSTAEKTAIAPPSLSFSNITFGYHFYSPFGSNDEGAFYGVLGSDGHYRMAGENGMGQLGNKTTTNSIVPTQFAIPSPKIAKQAFSSFLSLGFDMFVVMTDGTVYGAGANDSGQLGNDPITARVSNPMPFRIPGYEKARYVAVKGEQTYVITESNYVYSAGNCASGLLGTGCSSGSFSMPAQVQGLPTPDSTNPNTIPDEMTLDANTVILRTQGGQVYGWGANQSGMFGTGNYIGSTVAMQLGTFGKPGYPLAKQVRTDGDSLYVLDSNGDVWVAGRNSFGELGTPPSSDVLNFTRFPIPAGAAQLATDQWSIIIRMSNGDVYGAGLNTSGELGNGTSGWNTTAPTKVQLNGKQAKFIYNTSTGDNNANYNTTLMIMTDGSVWGMGSNYYGQLGTGSNGVTVNSVPLPMKIVNGVTASAVDVKSGLGTTIILLDTGSYMTVGNNKYGQLGNGTTTEADTPIIPQYFKTIPAYLF
jgi:alpha-tubulin suppressor-like RCC1 family protein/Tfp pilus assembly protein PilX